MDQNALNFNSDILTPKEIRRYLLQINSPFIGMEGQEKLKQAKILVVGAGGKGSTVLQNLATIGIGKIGISDNFPVEEGDLSRQFLYGNGDLGKQKAIVSKQKLLEINHFNQYVLHNVCLAESNVQTICKDYDILIDATDNFSSRFLISDTAIKLGKPMIFGMMDGNLGLVSVFNYMDGPSLRCLFPEKQKAKKKEQSDEFLCQVSLMGVIGSVIANESIKVILGVTSKLSGNLLIYDAENYSMAFKEIKKNRENFT